MQTNTLVIGSEKRKILVLVQKSLLVELLRYVR